MANNGSLTLTRTILIILGRVMSDPNPNRCERLRGPVSVMLDGMQVAARPYGRIAASPRAFFC